MQTITPSQIVHQDSDTLSELLDAVVSELGRRHGKEPEEILVAELRERGANYTLETPQHD